MALEKKKISLGARRLSRFFSLRPEKEVVHYSVRERPPYERGGREVPESGFKRVAVVEEDSEDEAEAAAPAAAPKASPATSPAAASGASKKRYLT